MAPGGSSLRAFLPQEAERNARELVAEEERAKRKAEKKKLKKKVGEPTGSPWGLGSLPLLGVLPVGP